METDRQQLDRTTFSPEMQLLLVCSQQDRTEGQRKELQTLLARPIDWGSFFHLAMKNKVYPIVYKNLHNLEGLRADETVLTAFEEKYRQNLLHSMQLAAELSKVMDAFEKNGVRAISLKGPALGLRVYGDLSLRTSKDLDILVDAADLEKAENLLLNGGYIKENKVALSPKQKQVLLKATNHFSYRNGNGVIIELHWQLFSYVFHIPFDERWENGTEVILSGKPIHVLGKEEGFLNLVVHGSKHAWKRLRWLCDINELLRKNDLDWAYIQKRANQLKISHMLGQALLLCNQLFQTEIRKDILEKERVYKTARKFAVLAVPFILATEESPETAGHSLYRYYKKYMLVWNGGICRGLQYIKMHFYPVASDFEKVQFKDKYFFMYYLVRPLFKLKRIWGEKENKGQ